MAVTTTKTNKPINPRGNDQSPKGYNRAALYSGKALDFDGVNDDVLSTITISGAKTYCAWINADGTDNERIISISEGGYSNITFVNNKFGMYDGTNIPETTTTFETGQWYFVVGVQEANNAKIYVNGISQPLSTTNWIERTHTGATIAIGRDAAGGAYYDGKISGVRIFNTALTAAQVSDLYNNPEKIVPTGVADSALKLWLPMMEGAGTTAYDGSGNGNHGTISGATYVNGVGAPVAQSAVIDWNKGTNLLTYSEEIDNAIWQKVASGAGSLTPIVTANYGISPDGTQTAERIQLTRGSGASAYSYVYQSISVTSGQTYSWSVWLKSLSGTPSVALVFDGSSYDNIVTLTNEWAKYTFTGVTGGAGIQSTFLLFEALPTTSLTADFLAWGAQVNAGSVGPYVPTIGTTQTSPVLLPQGLTSGRDITGVNLFENVRKQAALNLDGNSWAEVHDNASLDFSSGMTLEAWFQIEANSFGRHVLGKWNFPANKREYLIYWNGSVNKIECYFGNGGAAQSANVSVTPTGQWVHFVGATDGSTITPYLNGVAGTTATQTQPLGDSDIDLKIGTDDTNTSAQYRMNTPVAQPRIYNRALTAEEVQRNYDAGKNTYKN